MSVSILNFAITTNGNHFNFKDEASRVCIRKFPFHIKALVKDENMKFRGNKEFSILLCITIALYLFSSFPKHHFTFHSDVSKSYNSLGAKRA